MENNVAVNTENAYQLSGGAYNTVLIPGENKNVENLIKEREGKSQNTYIDYSKWSKWHTFK
jgi:hypothetical protein